MEEIKNTSISLDFVLDTAANTNTINAMVAEELDLENSEEALPDIAVARNAMVAEELDLENSEEALPIAAALEV